MSERVSVRLAGAGGAAAAARWVQISRRAALSLPFSRAQLHAAACISPAAARCCSLHSRWSRHSGAAAFVPDITHNCAPDINTCTLAVVFRVAGQHGERRRRVQHLFDTAGSPERQAQAAQLWSVGTR